MKATDFKDEWISTQWQYTISATKNITSMLDSVATGTKRSFYLVMILAIIIFGVGTVILILATLVTALQGREPLWALVFGGLSIADAFAFVLFKPLSHLRENIIDFSALTVLYNGYVTRLKQITGGKILSYETPVKVEPRDPEVVNKEIGELVESTFKMLAELRK